MKTRPLKNYGSSVGCEVYDIDLNSDDEIIALGQLVADQCVVFVDQNVATTRLFEVMNQWGDPSRALVFDYVSQKKLTGRHWREILLMLGWVTAKGENVDSSIAAITYKKDAAGKPLGMFSNGELDWHSDQCALDDAQRIIGLQSIEHSKNSQTTFLCTHDAFESMSSSMQSTVKELVCRHRWQEGVCAPGLNEAQSLLVHFNMVPVDGMETKLYTETVTGRSGMKIPSHSFDGFVGMSQTESHRLFEEIKKHVFKPQYVYTQDWNDGQLMFMDQEITLHARPTNIKDGNLRTMARVITYLNKIFPHSRPTDSVRIDGKSLTHQEFAKIIDDSRREEFAKEQSGKYNAMLSDEIWSENNYVIKSSTY
jgi:alpha-ketoglutarate-dependent taurine dioxygenase